MFMDQLMSVQYGAFYECDVIILDYIHIWDEMTQWF